VYVVIDIETDGFDASVVHCVACLDDQNQERVFTEPTGFQEYLSGYDMVIAHNGIQFDYPMLKILWGITIPASKQYDTLIASRLIKPDLENGHSLEAWGCVLASLSLLNLMIGLFIHQKCLLIAK